MKVLQVVNSLTAGGAQKLIGDFVPVMNTKGITVDVLLFTEAKGPFLERLLNHNVRVLNIKSQNLYSPANALKAAKYLKDYDIVHSHLFPANYWTALAKLAKPFANRKVKLVTTEHSNTNRRFEKAYFRPVDRFIYRQYSTLIAISESVQQVLWNRLHHPNIPIVYNAVNVQELAQAVPVPFPHNQINLLMVASFSEPKDHITLIKAVAQLDDHYHLYLAGQGSTESECRELCKTLKVEHRVHFMGGRKDIPGLMKAADLNVLSSHWEGLSCVTLESMASGTPFIGTDINGIKELFPDNKFPLFKNGDVNTLAEKIKKVTQDKAFAKEQSQSNFAAVQQYDIDIMAQRYIDIYKKLLS
ncbi:MAG: glycosyltransferase [Agriterribacter sp.]